MSEYTERVAANVIWVEEKILMAKRVSDNTFEFVGGKEEEKDLVNGKPDEDSIKKTAVRELEEELGIYAEPLQVGESYPSATADLDIAPVEMEYTGTQEDLKEEIYIGREHSEYALIYPEEIDSLDHAGQKKCLLNLGILD